MTSLATAKVLLFIALSVGPRQTPDVVFATSTSANYVFTQTSGGWNLKTKCLPADDWNGRGVQPTPDSYREREFRAIAHHRWSEGASLDLRDGSRIEKQRHAVFYIENPGAPNQTVFTILYPRD